MASKKRLIVTIVVAVLALALIVLAATVLPILTHQNTGSSGQQPIKEFVPEVSATGVDERTRTLKIVDRDGAPIDGNAIVPGQQLRVIGSGFNSGIGIYVSFCEIPEEPDQKPGPCLGEVPASEELAEAADHEELASRWITNNWAWKSFATDSFDGDGFDVPIVVPEPVGNGADCLTNLCGVSTRADHTFSKDRVQDLYIPLRWQQAE